MYYSRDGFPEDDELILCTVTSVQYNSVFCNLDEYPGKSGMIHISEVTAGRIRNIREYVQEGRKVVCKVLRVDEGKGHIDLSLRRVNERQRIEKNAELKQELKAENLLAFIAKELKRDAKEFYDEIAPQIFEHYIYLHQAFEAIVVDEFSLDQTKIDKKIAKQIEELVRERIQPAEVSIEGVLSVTTFAPSGVTLVRDALVAAEQAGESAIVRYLGGGTYKVVVTADEYKTAEKYLKQLISTVEDMLKKVPSTTISFERRE